MKRLVLLLCFACLTACGFHLRGAIDVPAWLTNVALISSEGENKELLNPLKTQLEGYKIKINPDPTRAQYWLIITHARYQQHITSVGASTNPRQYQLILNVGFMLQERKGKIIKPATELVVTRQLTVNNDLILGSNEEEAILLREMRQDIILQMINRLSRK